MAGCAICFDRVFFILEFLFLSEYAHCKKSGINARMPENTGRLAARNGEKAL
ncbi:hypothetical protein DES37_10687 [Mangrovibacter plantisponsor]|uniref:Uncharacterized protein n=1 Tax=Mangrovibacter plantisponsor TaxID=451513 RepID=A0A317PZ81_9ENTR|nr:hypothetical protein DES37_10687 [Mangrovibacter plantisponsor]